jgi:hypothetical protein
MSQDLLSVCRIFVVVHHERYFTTAAGADEYLILQTHGAVGWLNSIEPQLATAAVAVGRRRRFDEGTHAVPFARDVRSEGMGRSKGSRLNGWIESPNALRWSLGRLSGCAIAG